MSEPLPSREAIVELLVSQGKPMRALDIATKLSVEDSAKPGFFRLLDNLALDGTLLAHNRDRFGLPKARVELSDEEREGLLSVSARGFGFVRVSGFDDDIFVPEESMAGALHGDRVVVKITRKSALSGNGEIVRIVERGHCRVPGILRRNKSAWVEPDDTRVRGPIVISRDDDDGRGNDGEAVVVEITRYPLVADENPQGRIVAVLGEPGDPKVEAAKILVRFAVEEEHPAAAVTEAEAFGGVVPDEALKGRVDLTHIPLPTIDPTDARDHDDAVWVERADDGTYTAYIAIADVSHYVQPGTALDLAALTRGCSIYLPDRAIPMLPRALSSNLCSLLPDVIRLCLCAIVTLDAGGNVTSARIVEGFMRSRAKLTYEGVARALGFTTKPKKQPAAEEMVEGLKVADVLTRILRTKRMRRGSLDLDVPEPKIELDPKTGAPESIERRGEDPGVKRAYEIIEELMLLANEVVAHFLVSHGRETVFRVHPPPDETRLENYASLCERMGAPFTMEDGRDPKKLSQFIKKLVGHPKADVLHMMLLRALKQAFYNTQNIGHFGLASPEYVHFTSPIRRYPDLLVHRGVREVLRDQNILGSAPISGPPSSWKRGVTPWPLPSPAPPPVAPIGDSPPKRSVRTSKPPVSQPRVETKNENATPLQQAASMASNKERRAMEVERGVVDLYRAFYMRKHIGETFEGTVTAMTGTGVFVQLDSPFVDVLVRADGMGKEAYTLNDELMMYVAPRSGDTIALGDRMVVTIEDVSILKRQITGWRHAPDVIDREPLRQSPFTLKEQIAKKRARSQANKSEKNTTRRTIRTGRKRAPTKVKKRRLLIEKSRGDLRSKRVFRAETTHQRRV